MRRACTYFGKRAHVLGKGHGGQHVKRAQPFWPRRHDFWAGHHGQYEGHRRPGRRWPSCNLCPTWDMRDLMSEMGGLV